MARRPREQRPNIFLMKESTSPSDVVRGDIEGLVRIPIANGFDFAGEIVVKASHPNRPRWFDFIQSGTASPLGSLSNQSASCLVVLSMGDPVFAIAFGHGRHWIDDARIVRRFGMITTLNTVDSDRIRSIGREEFETIQRKTRSQTSTSAKMENFGLDVQRDLMRSVTGQPQDPRGASRVRRPERTSLG